MNVLSLFDGISCGYEALQRAGIPITNYFASEIDENAIQISKSNHKGIVQIGDVTKWEEWDLPKIDLIIGGSPCQGFSRNGNMLNFGDPRSKLLFDFVDIVKANPHAYFLLENVKMKTEWRNVINEQLGVQGMDINSKLLSAQNRLRTYWTNIEGVVAPKDAGILLKDILQPTTCELVKCNGIWFESNYSQKAMDLVSVVDGQVRIKQATKKGYIIAKDGDGINLSFPTSTTRRGRVIKQKSPTLDCMCDVSVLIDGVIRHLNLQELEMLQTLPIGYTNAVIGRSAKIAIGNGWTVDVIAHILKHLEE